MSAIISDTQRTRGDMFMKQFDKMIERMMGLDLSGAGMSVTRKKIYAGGISRGDKQSVEQNTDRVAPRFARGQFRNPLGVQDVGTDTASP